MANTKVIKTNFNWKSMKGTLRVFNDPYFVD